MDASRINCYLWPVRRSLIFKVPRIFKSLMMTSDPSSEVDTLFTTQEEADTGMLLHANMQLKSLVLYHYIIRRYRCVYYLPFIRP